MLNEERKHTAGDWKESNVGTSAGTVLGALLFILQVHDSPPPIKPKFADDFNTVAVGKNTKEVEAELQVSVNELALWPKENDIILNKTKIQVVLFGSDEPVKIYLENHLIEQKDQKIYLGIMLDSKLSFESHLDLISSRALKALAKISRLIRGRRGISIGLAIDLYNSLIRPHLEYAAPVWAGLSLDKMKKLERVQAQCLKTLMGAHKHSASEAVEVVSGVLPIRFRLQELCIREFYKVSSKESTNPLVIMLEDAKSIKNKFTPLSYLKSVAKTVKGRMNDLGISPAKAKSITPEDILAQRSIERISVIEKVGNSKTRTKEQVKTAKEAIDDFHNANKGKSILVYTDGSVHNRCKEQLPQTLGFGACAAVLIPLEDGRTPLITTKDVGTATDNVECEVVGVQITLEAVDEYVKSLGRKDNLNVFIFTDCIAAIDIACNQANPEKSIENFKEIWKHLEKFEKENIKERYSIIQCFTQALS